MFNRSKSLALLAVFAFVFVLTGIAQQKTDETVTCPVSGEVMKKSEAKISTEYKGKTYYFCCPGCKEKFLKDPEKFAQNPAGAKDSYTCPMHPEVTSDKPGKCPQCGMDLQKKSMMQGPAHAGMGAGHGMMMPGGMMSEHGRMPHRPGMMMAGGWLLLSKDVVVSVENTPDGAVIKLSSKNPDLVKVIQGHAAMLKIMREKGQACCQTGEVKKEDVKK